MSSKMRFVLGITGASGIPIGVRVAEKLADEGKLFTVVSDAAKKVMEYETDDKEDTMRKLGEYSEDVYGEDEIEAPIASGSFDTRGMVIAPCSMNTLGSLAHGLSSNLVERAGDVCIKERRKLVLVPRETPLGQIHLENMHKLSEAGVDIVPPMLGFYFGPDTIDDLVDYVTGKVLERFGIKNKMYRKWNCVLDE